MSASRSRRKPRRPGTFQPGTTVSGLAITQTCRRCQICRNARPDTGCFPFECEKPADFMHLMLTLRDTEASRYTERDTPIFVGRLAEIRKALDELDGARISIPVQ